MGKKRSPARAQVWRITVDEKLADDLIRVAKCRLAEGVTEFLDRSAEWGAERESLIRPKDYVRKLGIPSRTEWPWEALEEGQVFLAGEFEVVPQEGDADPPKPAYFKVRRGRSAFLRIDNLEPIWEGTKRLYSDALVGRLGT